LGVRLLRDAGLNARKKKLFEKVGGRRGKKGRTINNSRREGGD